MDEFKFTILEQAVRTTTIPEHELHLLVLKVNSKQLHLLFKAIPYSPLNNNEERVIVLEYISIINHYIHQAKDS